MPCLAGVYEPRVATDVGRILIDNGFRRALNPADITPADRIGYVTGRDAEHRGAP